MRCSDIPASGGFGEPLGSILRLDDGEVAVALVTADTTGEEFSEQIENGLEEDSLGQEVFPIDQPSLFVEKISEESSASSPSLLKSAMGMMITKTAKGFRFALDSLREPTKRMGRKIVNLEAGDEVVAVRVTDSEYVLVAESEGHVLMFRLDKRPLCQGLPGE